MEELLKQLGFSKSHNQYDYDKHIKNRIYITVYPSGEGWEVAVSSENSDGSANTIFLGATTEKKISLLVEALF
ncbi:MAG: hypothetical protein WC456_00235 [Patescibacteria group bacterium]